MSATIEIKNDVSLITMDDGKANAINPTMIKALNECLDKAEEESKAVIITGRAGVFCGGFDLKIMRGSCQETREKLVKDGNDLICRLIRFPHPVLTAISGHAIAMGFFIALASDGRIGADGEFNICANETAIGLSLPLFAAELAKAKIQPSELMNAIGFSKPYSPSKAVEAGVLSSCVPEAELLEVAHDLASRLTALPRESFAFNKIAMFGDVADKIMQGA